MSKINYKETYFQHDRYARQDPKIKAMLQYFRKISEDKAKAAVCVFWWIVEDMHIDSYPVEKIDVFADDYRCDVEFLKSILEDFKLFRIENNCYVSDRVLRNIQIQKEKSEKARKAILKRWKNQKEAKETIDFDFVNQVIQIFNKEFKKTQIVSNANKHRILQIHKENNLTLDIWNKVFSNAKRGWDIDGRENVQPSLSLILDKWDSFASDDYFLAPDREAIAEKKKEEKDRVEREKSEYIKAREIEDKEKENFYNSINSKEAALEYMCRYCPALKIDNDVIIRRNSTFKEFAEKFDITVSEFNDFRTNFPKTKKRN